MEQFHHAFGDNDIVFFPGHFPGNNTHRLKAVAQQCDLLPDAHACLGKPAVIIGR